MSDEETFVKIFCMILPNASLSQTDRKRGYYKTNYNSTMKQDKEKRVLDPDLLVISTKHGKVTNIHNVYVILYIKSDFNLYIFYLYRKISSQCT